MGIGLNSVTIRKWQVETSKPEYRGTLIAVQLVLVIDRHNIMGEFKNAPTSTPKLLSTSGRFSMADVDNGGLELFPSKAPDWCTESWQCSAYPDPFALFML
ncbi:hypothetical protein EG328_006704 [Venturia inaequalis]|uniref:Uncharacterized protein n=1 Tax=Venturia inaequalis TaxID=5025 RepID=A0A8H3Z068_VENIN|nr:hypothetical protein EG328_006704 [Venturia inaequalis]KAE9975206.1 hypothetical protein EG327_008519 [Venturia inaequalis]